MDTRKLFAEILLAAFLIMLPASSFAGESNAAEKTVDEFYHALLSEDLKTYPLVLNRYVVKETLKRINEFSECNYDDENNSVEHNSKCSQKRTCKKSKINYICNWNGLWIETDVNYFTKSQDAYPSWINNIKISLYTKSSSDILYEVALGKPPEPVMKLLVRLKLEKGIWKIIDVTEH